MDQPTATWTLPAARAKNGRAHIVPLNAHAVAELDALARRARRGTAKWPRSGLVFSTTGKTPVSGHSRAKTRWDAAIDRLAASAADNASSQLSEAAPWRLHDLRRTLATGMQRLGIRFEVTEAILNHVSGARSGVAGVYQRHDWKDEKRTALEAWATHISSLLASPDIGKVVPLRSKARSTR